MSLDGMISNFAKSVTTLKNTWADAGIYKLNRGKLPIICRAFIIPHNSCSEAERTRFITNAPTATVLLADWAEEVANSSALLAAWLLDSCGGISLRRGCSCFMGLKLVDEVKKLISLDFTCTFS